MQNLLFFKQAFQCKGTIFLVITNFLVKFNKLFFGWGRFKLEPIEGKLRGGGFDKILWTAETPAIAQNYIPESGSSWFVRKPYEHEMQTIWSYPKSDFENKILKHMGGKFNLIFLHEGNLFIFLMFCFSLLS